MLELFAILYALISIPFILETYAEGERERNGWDLWRIVGLGLCLVWPIHAAIVFAAVVRSRPAPEPARCTLG